MRSARSCAPVARCRAAERGSANTMSERGSADTMKRSSQRGTAMTASVMRLRRDALSYLLGLGLLLAAALMVCGSLAAPAWGQGTDQPADRKRTRLNSSH